MAARKRGRMGLDVYKEMIFGNIPPCVRLEVWTFLDAEDLIRYVHYAKCPYLPGFQCYRVHMYEHLETLITKTIDVEELSYRVYLQ